jgi:hypothetical protein
LRVLVTFFLVLVVVLNGCSSIQDDIDKPELLTINNIQDALNEQKIQYQDSEIIKQYLLRASVSQKSLKLENGEELYIYTFKNEALRIQGLQEIKDQTALMDIVFTPYFYEAKNVLLIYMRLNDVEGFEGKISNIMQSLQN